MLSYHPINHEAVLLFHCILSPNHRRFLLEIKSKMGKIFHPYFLGKMTNWFIGLLVNLHDQTGYTTNN